MQSSYVHRLRCSRCPCVPWVTQIACAGHMGMSVPATKVSQAVQRKALSTTNIVKAVAQRAHRVVNWHKKNAKALGLCLPAANALKFRNTQKTLFCAEWQSGLRLVWAGRFQISTCCTSVVPTRQQVIPRCVVMAQINQTMNKTSSAPRYHELNPCPRTFVLCNLHDYNRAAQLHENTGSEKRRKKNTKSKRESHVVSKYKW